MAAGSNLLFNMPQYTGPLGWDEYANYGGIPEHLYYDFGDSLWAPTDPFAKDAQGGISSLTNEKFGSSVGDDRAMGGDEGGFVQRGWEFDDLNAGESRVVDVSDVPFKGIGFGTAMLGPAGILPGALIANMSKVAQTEKYGVVSAPNPPLYSQSWAEQAEDNMEAARKSEAYRKANPEEEEDESWFGGFMQDIEDMAEEAIEGVRGFFGGGSDNVSEPEIATGGLSGAPDDFGRSPNSGDQGGSGGSGMGSGQTSGPGGMGDAADAGVGGGGYHDGGIVDLKQNEVEAVLQKGEYVINKETADSLGEPFLVALNKFGKEPLDEDSTAGLYDGLAKILLSSFQERFPKKKSKGKPPIKETH